jgi:autotransporter-associated beta strand protein
MSKKHRLRSTGRLAGGLAAAASFALLGPDTAKANTIDWTGGTSTAWATGSNWVGGTAPTNDLTTDIASFNQASYTFQPNAGTTSIAGVQIGASSAAFTLSTTNLSIGSSGITKAAGSGAFTLGAVTLGATQTWTNSSSSDFVINGAVGGSGVTFNLTSNGTTGKFSQKAKITATSTAINLTSGSYWEIGSATPGNDAFGGNTNTVGVANGAQMKIAWNQESYNNSWTFSGGTGLSATSYTLRIDQAKLLGTVTLSSGDTVFSAWNRTNSQLSGKITGAGALTFGAKDAVTGNGATTVYNTSNDWTGGLTIQSNNWTTTLNLGASGVLTDTGSVTFNNVSTTNRSILDMKGFNETVDLLVSSGSSASSATGIITNSGATQSTLTLGGGSASSATFTGVIQDGTSSIALTKSGSGTQILAGANTYTGATTINGGTLKLASTGSLASTTLNIAAGGAIFDVSAKSSYSLASNAITLSLDASSIGTINAGALAVDFGSVALTLNLTTATPGASYDFLTSTSSATGTYASVTLTGSSFSGTLSNAGTIWSGTSNGYNFSLDQTSGVLSITAVPEPHEFAIAISALLGVLVFIRRRNQQA